MADLEFCKVQNRPAYLVYAGDTIIARIDCPLEGRWTVTIPHDDNKGTVREVKGPGAAREYVQGYFDGIEASLKAFDGIEASLEAVAKEHKKARFEAVE